MSPSLGVGLLKNKIFKNNSNNLPFTIRKVRPREENPLIQGHTTGKEQRENYKSSALKPLPHIMPPDSQPGFQLKPLLQPATSPWLTPPSPRVNTEHGQLTALSWVLCILSQVRLVLRARTRSIQTCFKFQLHLSLDV